MKNKKKTWFGHLQFELQEYGQTAALEHFLDILSQCCSWSCKTAYNSTN